MAAIEIYHGDITCLKVDAIVNAANINLLGGGGVDGAIHRKAGPELLDYCRGLGGCQTGDAKITPGFMLPARFVIHTVGPVWKGGRNGEDELLESAYTRSLEVAIENQVKTIAFPNISTGVYGFPKDRAAGIAFRSVNRFILAQALIEKVIFVVFDEENLILYKNMIRTNN